MKRIAEWALPLLLFAFLDASIVYPNDYWWHVETGAVIARTHHVPDIELFAYTREGLRWVNEPWLMQLLMYGVFTLGGLALGVFVHALFVAGGYALVWRETSKRVGASSASFATLVGACVGAANWGVRPQGASFLFFGACIALIERDRAKVKRALWLAVPLFALWANCHGGFVFGLLALEVYIAVSIVERLRAGERDSIRELVLVGVASVLACALTPIGPRGIVEHVGAFLASRAQGVHNDEFVPLSLTTPDGLIFIYAVVRLALAVRKSRTWPRPNELAQLALFGALAIAARRASPWFGLAVIPILARALPSSDAPPRFVKPLAAFVVTACVVTLPWLRPHVPVLSSLAPLMSRDTPAEGAKWACAHIPEGERLWTGQVHASYLEGACPRLGVFVDTRVQAFPPALWDEYLTVEGARPGWEDVLAKWKVRWLMLEPGQDLVLKAARTSPRWHQEYADDRAIVFSRVAEY